MIQYSIKIGIQKQYPIRIIESIQEPFSIITQLEWDHKQARQSSKTKK